MNTKILYYLSILLLLVLIQCKQDEYHYPEHNIFVVNHLDTKDIAVVVPYRSFPDNLKYDSLILSLETAKPIYYVYPHQSVKILSCEYQIYWHSDTLSIYFIDKKSLQTNSWEFITRDTLWQKKYELSLSDINILKDTIPYPPTPSMQNMKMYPSYEKIINSEQK